MAVTGVLVMAAGGCGGDPSGPAANAADRSALPQVSVVDHTYEVPQPLPDRPPGTLIAATDHGPDTRFDGARRWTLLYHSVNAHRADVPVSGMVLLPPGAPPRGGWPVVSWAHGTTGVADACAPSQMTDLGSDAYAKEVRALLQAGYAVTASDYPGLGTPGMHTYLVGVDEGNAVVDIVTAARHLLPGLGNLWFAVGHSQGGQAALFAAQAPGRAGGARLAGTVALAPASHLEAMLPGVKASHVPSELSFAFYALAGLTATDPSHTLPALLGAQTADIALRVLAQCQSAGYPALRHLDTERALPLSTGQLARIGAQMGAYGDPDRTAIPTPVLIIQGQDDHDVPPVWTAAVASNLRRLGSPAIATRTYPGVGHDGVLGQSFCDLLTFLNTHAGHRPTPCTPFRTDSG
ncbi:MULTISPECIES: alpha/beta hydrolase family protein [unclassified Streptomyces]|uniref:alpha/beta hydrolase family protein n=1 Tax=unclassified Streptomyces TaxID=2593676 RepID=UPI0037F13231